MVIGIVEDQALVVFGRCCLRPRASRVSRTEGKLPRQSRRQDTTDSESETEVEAEVEAEVETAIEARERRWMPHLALFLACASRASGDTPSGRHTSLLAPTTQVGRYVAYRGG